MIDDTQADKPVEEPTAEPSQDEPMPSSEPAEAVDAPNEAELPEDVSERTKEQFNKLKEANKALKEQLDKKATIEPIFDSMRPKTAPQPVLTQNQLDSVTDTDPTTGERFLNEQKLNTLLTQTAQKADQAIAQVQQMDQHLEDQRQLNEAYQEYPELNPNIGSEKFNKNLFNQTEAYVVHSMVRPDLYGGKPLSYKAAADIASSATKAEIAKVEKEANAQQTAKEQGSLEATGRSDRRTDVDTSREDLRQRARNGDEDALAALVGD